MGKKSAGPTCYEVMQVHPAAPFDLITAAYWRLAERLQVAGREDSRVALHRLTRAYETLADVASRAAYDASISLRPRAPVPPVPRRLCSTSWLGRLLHRAGIPAAGDAAVDYYEVLRVRPRAEPAVITDARDVMRDHYLRLVRTGIARPALLALLDEAYAVTGDAERRQLYDAARARRGRGPPGEAAAGRSPRRRTSVAAEHGRHRPGRAASPEPDPDAGTRGASAANAAGSGAPRQPAPLFQSAAAQAGRWASWTGACVLAALEGALSALFRLAGPRPAVEGPDPQIEEAVLLSRLPVANGPAAGGLPPNGDISHQLVVTDGPSLGQAFPLNGGPLTLGSDGACQIALPGLAPKQARLWRSEQGFVLYSLTHSPATCVNGRRVVWAVLREGDLLNAGPHRLRFSLAA